jgi:catechol 2,3-dioxygenase
MKLGHVHIKVRDLAAAADFYKKLLKLGTTEEIGDDFVFLSFGEAHHDLALQRSSNPESPAPGGVGLYHTAFEVSSVEELRHKVEILEEMALPFQLVDHGISWALYTADPSGNGVEIFVDRRRANRPLWHGQSGRLSKSDLIC